MTAPRAALLAALAEAARAGGDAILPIYAAHVAQMRANETAHVPARETAQVRARETAPPPAAAAAQDAVALREKPDGSPLTAADLAADAAIAAALARLCPGIPVVSEEGDARNAPPRFLLVDPLDGTKEFLAGNGEFTVNIALIEDHEPVAGVVLAPALGVLWAGAAGQGATRTEIAPRPVGPGAAPHDPASDKMRPIQVRPRPAAPVAVASRSHADAGTEGFLARIGAGARRSVGSSLKFCLVAEGEADVYPRFAPTMEWDTAAGHAVLLAAGGRVEAPDGAPLRYGIAGRGWRNGHFIAWGGDLPGAA